MTNRLMAMIGALRPTAGRRVHAGCIAVCLAAAGMSLGGQTLAQRKTTLKSGSFVMLPGHSMSLLTTDVGDAQAFSRVRIEFRDASDNLVAQHEGDLTTRTPVRLQVTAPADGRTRFWRALVVITSSTPTNLTTPRTVLQDINPSAQTAIVLAQGGRPQPHAPGTNGDGPKMSCPDFELFETTL